MNNWLTKKLFHLRFIVLDLKVTKCHWQGIRFLINIANETSARTSYYDERVRKHDRYEADRCVAFGQ